jgi:hypothetical protein
MQLRRIGWDQGYAGQFDDSLTPARVAREDRGRYLIFGDFGDARDCRFRDCRHEDEPGCAVQAALAEGALDPARYESYLEQRRELAYHERRQDQRLQKEEEGQWRSIAMWSRKQKKQNPKGR